MYRQPDAVSFTSIEIGVRRGAVVDAGGTVLAEHDGVHGFTIGQRKGLGIALAEPMYVLELRPADQTVVVGPRPQLERTALTASQVNWIAGTPPDGIRRVTAQIRHRHQPAAATARCPITLMRLAR